jgi:ferredoxin--NADP+ reductase
MYRIQKKQTLSDTVSLMEVNAPQVARKARAGQFVMVRTREEGERIPLTIADYDKDAHTITLVIQGVGKSTMEMCGLNAGDGFATVSGPLGQPTKIENFGTVLCMAGGVGIAPLYPIARELKAAGNRIITIIGVRTKGMLFWEARMQSVSDVMIITTDDGSYGRKGIVTEPLKELLEERGDIAHVWAIGPAIMMKFIAETTRPFNIPTIVSLNTIMIDGTGMCGSCRVLTDEGPRFVCVDGPEFDAHKVDWNNMMQRLQFYRAEEQAALEHWRHKCQMGAAAAGVKE